MTTSRVIGLVAGREFTTRVRSRSFLISTVVILAVLGALVVPKLIENVDKARVTRAQSDIRAIQTALDLYRLDNFKYPTTEQGLQALVKQPADTTLTNYRAEGYLPALPKDLPAGLRSGLPNLPGLTGLSGKPNLPGLGGFPGLGKKK